MKATLKKLWLFLAAVVMAFATVFAVGCAKNDGDCSTAHSYGEWVVVKEATETEPGERKHTCTVCGNEETEAIPVLGSITAPVNAPEVLQKGNGVNIAIDPCEFTYKRVNKQPVLVSSPSLSTDWVIKSVIETKITLHGGYGYLGINDEGFLYAYGKVSFNLKADETFTETQKTESTETLHVSNLLFDNNCVYAIDEVYTKNAETGEFTVRDEEAGSTVQLTFEQILEDQDESVQQVLQILFGRTDDLLDYVNTDLRPFAEELANAFGLNRDEAQQRLLSMFLKESESGNGYLLEMRANAFTNLGNDICNLPLNQLIDKYCGAGTFAQIEKLPEALDVTVGRLMEQLAAKGITAEKITAFADKTIQFITDTPEASLEDFLKTDLVTYLKPYENVTLGELILQMTDSDGEDYDSAADTCMIRLENFYRMEKANIESDNFNFEKDWAQFVQSYEEEGYDWVAYIDIVKSAYQACNQDEYNTYFGEGCTKEQNVMGMVNAFDNTQVSNEAKKEIANRLNPYYGKSDEEIEAMKKAETDAKIAEMKTMISAGIAGVKDATLPQLIENASDGETTAAVIQIAINGLTPMLDQGVSLKVSLDSNRIVTGYDISLSKALLSLVCDMSASSSSDGTTEVNGLGLKCESDIKLSVAFGAENAENKADFNAEEFLKLFPSQPQTDGE